MSVPFACRCVDGKMRTEPALSGMPASASKTSALRPTSCTGSRYASLGSCEFGGMTVVAEWWTTNRPPTVSERTPRGRSFRSLYSTDAM